MNRMWILLLFLLKTVEAGLQWTMVTATNTPPTTQFKQSAQNMQGDQMVYITGYINSRTTNASVWLLNPTNTTAAWTSTQQTALPLWTGASGGPAIIKTDPDTGIKWMFGLSNGKDLRNISWNGFVGADISAGAANLPEPRQSGGMAIYMGIIFVYMGNSVTSGSCVVVPPTLYGYNISAGTWTPWNRLGPTFNGRFSASFIPYNGDLYEFSGVLYGGGPGTTGLYKLKLNYTTQSFNRTKISDIPANGRGGGVAVMVGSRMFAIGGIVAGPWQTWYVDLANSSYPWVQIGFNSTILPPQACEDWPQAMYNASQTTIVVVCNSGASVYYLNIAQEIASWGQNSNVPLSSITTTTSTATTTTVATSTTTTTTTAVTSSGVATTSTTTTSVTTPALISTTTTAVTSIIIAPSASSISGITSSITGIAPVGSTSISLVSSITADNSPPLTSEVSSPPASASNSTVIIIGVASGVFLLLVTGSFLVYRRLAQRSKALLARQAKDVTYTYIGDTGYTATPQELRTIFQDLQRRNIEQTAMINHHSFQDINFATGITRMTP